MIEPTALTVSDLTVERGGRRLIDGLAFDLHAGTALVVTGPNGTGKSTLLRALAGFLPPVRGRVAVSGSDSSERPIEGLCHYLGHADGLKRTLSGEANLTFAAAWSGGIGLSAGPALARFGIEALMDLPAGYLSAGQRRRVALARLLVSHRPIWLLDEPTTALDTAAEATLGSVMRDHLATGGLIVAATHAPLPIPARRLELGAA